VIEIQEANDRAQEIAQTLCGAFCAEEKQAPVYVHEFAHAVGIMIDAQIRALPAESQVAARKAVRTILTIHV
jgi:hypothetical protein